MATPIDLKALRAKQARLAKTIGKNGYNVLCTIAVLTALGAVLLWIVQQQRFAYLATAVALLLFMPAVWWKQYLSVLPVTSQDITGRLSVDVLMALKPSIEQQPQQIWQALERHWQLRFFTNRFLITTGSVKNYLGTTPAELEQALQIATKLADDNDSPTIEVGFVVAGLLATSKPFADLLVILKNKPEDVLTLANWLGRILHESRAGQPHYGGIARDWVFGFTPVLDKLGFNVSRRIMQHGTHFGSLVNSKGVLAMEAALQNRGSAIALIGPSGIGKTNSVYGLAQRLIEGHTAGKLAYHQIVSLHAADVLSKASNQGLEQLMVSVANEVAHAANIILFLDDAQLFLGEGVGAFNASQILLPIVQAGSVPIIMALSPNDFQRLKSSDPSLANLMQPVVLAEPSETETLRIVEDSTLNLEQHYNVLISYEAIREAYRLSGRYDQDKAYPGKAIDLLEAAVSHAQQGAVTAGSVQQATEQAYGVKASSAAPAEADELLHLEDSIHQRMINQTHAVSVVANALRRARAGVTNPKRPIGSFLFLGPTGVGKTELAKAIAATYFRAESNLIRVDMSEYQQPDDVRRLLDSNQTGNLLLAVRQQPFSVVLLDEIEKAHPNVLNLLLQLLDEGRLTDAAGRPTSFKDCVIIVTSNAGAATIRSKITAGESLESFATELTDELIDSNQFKPELLNRFDEIVLFRPLTPSELGQVVQLLVTEINGTLANQNITIQLTAEAIAKIVEQGDDPRLGARPMRRMLQRAVEDTVAQKILRGEAHAGDRLTLDVSDLVL